MVGYKMNKMVEFETAQYEGFTLKKGFWYGKDLRGRAVATSTWVYNYENLALYVKGEEGWKLEWHNVDAWYLPQELREELEKKTEDERMWFEEDEDEYCVESDLYWERYC